MAKVTASATSFNGGELSRRMEGRVDTAIYQIGAAEMENFVPTVEGPAVKRPGFRYIRAAMASSSWLAPFVFNRTQAYVIEWGDQTLRFFTNGERIEAEPGVAYEVAVPYSAAQAPFVSRQQSFDRLYLAHSAHRPAALTRTGATAFAHTPLVLRNGPFGDQNSQEAISVTASGTTGGVTLSASAPIFLAGHVGSDFLIEANDFAGIKAWQVGIDGVTPGTKVRSDGKVYVAVSGSRTGSVQPIHVRGTEMDGMLGKDINDKDGGGVAWQYLHDRFGIVTITSVAGNGLSAQGVVTRRLADSLTTAPSHRWAHSAVSAAVGWPKIVLLAWGRLVFFTDFEIMASVAGDYGGGTVNFATFTDSGLLAPDMAFRRRLSITDPVLWAREDRGRIIVGTQSGEYAIQKLNSALAVSGDNIECVKQTKYGCAPVWPEEAGAELIFVQKGGRKLREADFDYRRDGYSAKNITVWSRHILNSGVRQLAFEQEPEEMVWAVRNDGVLAAHPHSPEQELKGFARVTLAAGGKVVSTIAIPAPDGDTDEQWALVERDGEKSIELRAAFWEEGTDVADAYFVDSGFTVENPASTTITGATWLAGRTIRILADGAAIPDTVVRSDGSFDLPYLPKKFHFGLGYAARLKNLRPEASGPNGSVQGKRKRFVNTVLRLLDTLGVSIDPGNGRPERLIDREGSAPMNEPEALFNGDTTTRSIGGNWERDGQGTIISDDAFPCVVLARFSNLEVTE